MKAMNVNNTRYRLHGIVNSVRGHIHELANELEEGKATASERNEFKELFEMMNEVISQADALTDSESEWSFTDESKEPDYVNPLPAGFPIRKSNSSNGGNS